MQVLVLLLTVLWLRARLTLVSSSLVLGLSSLSSQRVPGVGVEPVDNPGRPGLQRQLTKEKNTRQEECNWRAT